VKIFKHGDIGRTQPAANNPVFQYLKEKLNVTFTWDILVGDKNQKEDRYQKMWHITLPCIKPTIIILLIMSIGHILDAGFELQYLLLMWLRAYFLQQ